MRAEQAADMENASQVCFIGIQSKASHALSQLSLSLICLQFKSANSIAQTILLLSELLLLELFHGIGGSIRRRRYVSPWMVLLLRMTRRQTSLLQFALCDQRLFATLEFVEINSNSIEHGFDFRLDFGKQSRLSVL